MGRPSLRPRPRLPVVWLLLPAALWTATAAAAAPLEPLPGAPPPAAELQQRLAAALAARPEGSEPRTRHRRADGSPRFANRLLLEASPYLQQHAHNPVNWYPWGDEAFEAARRLGRPVLVSIGYSTCHWCHVMEEESFDDLEIAALLNAEFVAIKVDRETRPDVDAVYMAAVQALGKSGGWPLNVFVTPDREPFYGGTYFPPADRAGRMGFASVLRAVAEQYREEPDEVAKLAARVSAHVVRNLARVEANASEVPDPGVLAAAAEAFQERIDPVWGGIGRGNKFPSSVPVRLLLRRGRQTGDAALIASVERTLERMAAGGIQDHLGGGFHRYATDPRWQVPHFEKMLYDNALIARDYVEAHLATGRADFAAVARRTLDYLESEMQAPGGGFFSATDADSPAPSGELEEGRFYTWTPAELREVLGAEAAARVAAWFGVTRDGPVDGRSVLHTPQSATAVAAELGIPPEALRRTIERALPALRAARALRPPPLRDDKILTGWNGLAISAFARAGFVLDEPRYLATAAKTADFLLEAAFRDGRLTRLAPASPVAGPGFLEDHAFLIAGLLDLYEADANPRWLRAAIELQAAQDAGYGDPEGGGYYRIAAGQAPLLAREKPSTDGAVPAGNSVAALNLARLAELTGDPDPADSLALLFSAFRPLLEESPTRLPEMLLAVDFAVGGAREIALVEPPDGTGAGAMRDVVRETWAPDAVLVRVTAGPALEDLAATIPWVAGKRAQRGRTTAYVCQDRVCHFPTDDPETFARQLRGDGPPGAARDARAPTAPGSP